MTWRSLRRARSAMAQRFVRVWRRSAIQLAPLVLFGCTPPEASHLEPAALVLRRVTVVDVTNAVRLPEMDVVIQVLAERGIPLDPTLIAYHSKFFGDDPAYMQHPQQRLIPEIADGWWSVGASTADWTSADHTRAKRLWPKIEELVRRYHRAGVLLTAGSDFPVPWVIPGVSLHQELELLVQAGIPAIEVLRIATRNGAQALGLLDEIGTVDQGERADLVVLSGDPVGDIRNTRKIEMVIHAGQILWQP